MDRWKIEEAQQAVCTHYNASFVQTLPADKLGLATGTAGLTPINGLRHPQTIGTSGWYIWCGEAFSEAADFFEPLHAAHIYERLPVISHLLGLPAGYRFLLAGDYLDVWYDEKLLNV